ncbi:tRNA (guanosine(37)-N1)-methyltransferase TrmD [Candidatus Sneabacter namystus]|uniref:tRNA (guanine-N(1)-)-methyltransferase n=1 Tax=Candidatus Sneabacter namystus TaxID=2601646 RepID=A0A5C0UIK6_9RICK|nr:tRNA (guanosine(37)-N1)-methyltransferase TrmD [Candidatus Sneabacter namystus]QEK39629.1 tRNA (guanosine(37)-N1)-methyltransferase TrmD [Candidatus Sneabacter namystus]
MHRSNFHVKILSIFPEIFPGPLGISIMKNALNKQLWSYEVIDIRKFGIGKRKKVDDVHYGGLGGMVIRPDVLGKAIDAHKNNVEKIIYFSPKGKKLNQSIAKTSLETGCIMLICGRFEGVDERVLQEYNVERISIGDFILAGGELAAMVFLECCVRLLPGALPKYANRKNESFSEGFSGMLEHPLYTRPVVWAGRSVPDVLISGDKMEVEKWKMSASFQSTLNSRPDLIEE